MKFETSHNFHRRCLSTGLSLLFVLSILILPTPAQADFIFDPETGKFYRVDGDIEASAKEQFDVAEKFYNEQNWSEAIKAYNKVIKFFPSDPIVAESLFKLAESYVEVEEYGKAVDAYQRIITDYPQGERFDEIVRREFAIGEFMLENAPQKRILGVPFGNPYIKAGEIFDQVVKNAPYGEIGDAAQFKAGLAKKKAGKYTEAMDSFQTVLDNYPTSAYRDEASYALAEVSFLVARYQSQDSSVTNTARNQLDQFVYEYPESDLATDAQKLRQELDSANAKKGYEIGEFYEKDGFFKSATIYYKDVVSNFPNTKWAKKAQERIEAIEEPKDYYDTLKTRLEGQRTDISQEIQTVRAQYENLVKEGNKIEAEKVKKQLEILVNEQKTVSGRSSNIKKEKQSLLSRAFAAISRKQNDIKSKKKRLEERRKIYAKAPSDARNEALDMISERIAKEEEKLALQKAEFEKLQEELGVVHKTFWDATNISAIGGIGIPGVQMLAAPVAPLAMFFKSDTDKLVELANHRDKLITEKKVAYQDRKKLLLEISDLIASRSTVDADKDAFFAEIAEKASGFSQVYEQIRIYKDQLQLLESELRDKRYLYEQLQGPTGVIGGAQGALSVTAEVVSGLNIFAKKETEEQTEDSARLAKMEDLQSQMRVLEKQVEEKKQSIRDAEKVLKSKENAIEQKQIVRAYSQQFKEVDASYQKTRDALEKKLASVNREIRDVLNREHSIAKEEAQIYNSAFEKTVGELEKVKEDDTTVKKSDLESQKAYSIDHVNQLINRAALVKAEEELLRPANSAYIWSESHQISQESSPLLRLIDPLGFFQSNPSEQIVSEHLKQFDEGIEEVTAGLSNTQKRAILLDRWKSAESVAERKLVDSHIRRLDKELIDELKSEEKELSNEIKQAEKEIKNFDKNIEKVSKKDGEEVTVKLLESEKQKWVTVLNESTEKLVAIAALEDEILLAQDLRRQSVNDLSQKQVVGDEGKIEKLLNYREQELQLLSREQATLAERKRALYQQLRNIQSPELPENATREMKETQNNITKLQDKLSELEVRYDMNQSEIKKLDGGANVMTAPFQAMGSMLAPVGNLFAGTQETNEKIKKRLQSEMEWITIQLEKKKTEISALKLRKQRMESLQLLGPAAQNKKEELKTKLDNQVQGLKGLVVQQHEMLTAGEEPLSEDEQNAVMAKIGRLIEAVNRRENKLSEVNSDLHDIQVATDPHELDTVALVIEAEEQSLLRLKKRLDETKATLQSIDASEGVQTADAVTQETVREQVAGLQTTARSIKEEIEKTKHLLENEQKRLSFLIGELDSVQLEETYFANAKDQKKAEKKIGDQILKLLSKERKNVEEQASLYESWMRSIDGAVGTPTTQSAQPAILHLTERKNDIEHFLNNVYPSVVDSLEEEEKRIRSIQ